MSTLRAHLRDRSWLPFALLWIAGIDLRLTLLAVPPVLPLIHRDLRLGETGIAALTGLPVVLFAAAAVLGSLLVARLGPRRTMLLGLLGAGAASGLRGLGPSAAVLFLMTFVMGVGIAVIQPAIPSLINQWCPTRVGRATAVYVNGLLVGETLSASLTLPLALPLAHGSWELSLAFWAVPVLLTAPLLAWFAPDLPQAGETPRVAWWPDWKGVDTWRLGLLLGGTGAVYFGSNAFIPEFLRTMGRPDLIGAGLTVLNAAQLPASLVAALVSGKAVGRRGPFLAIGVTMLCGLGVFLVGGDWGLVLAAGMLGVSCGFGLVFCLALPPALAGREDVHRLSAGMLAIGYTYTFVAPLLGGAAWDYTHTPAVSFFPAACGALTVLAAASGLAAPRRAADPA